jgi:hypothetical protein
MATLVIVIHEFDVFAFRRGPRERIRSPYMLFDVLPHLESCGHAWRVTKGAQQVDGDIAMLHVDSTVVSEEYLALGAHYPRTINFGTGDISKRKVSRNLLQPNDDWDGPVVVKADLNRNGLMEVLHNQRAEEMGQPAPHPGVVSPGHHRLVDRLQDVEDEVWADPSLVVEKFLPERDEDGGFVVRTWVFLGKRERCTRLVYSDWLGKADATLRYEAVEVPEALRAERARLNFDYGKFDFVIHDGEPVLLDANRTPGIATAVRERIKEGALNLTAGLLGLMEEPLRG